ncbi:hypothetical protein ACLOJK_034069 [Asimina triloba]
METRQRFFFFYYFYWQMQARMLGEMERACGGGGGYTCDGGVVSLSRDPKPRLRWTPDLHDRFVDAVTKLGGPDSESSFFPFLRLYLHLLMCAWCVRY